MFDFKVTAELIAAVAGVTITLLFKYFPGLNVWFAKKLEAEKQLWMLVMMILVSGGIFGGGCIDLFKVNITCSIQGGWELAGILITGIVANQGVFRILPTPKKVKLARID